MKRAVLAACGSALLLAGPGCALFHAKKSEIPEATLPDWIGRVVMVDATHNFVLVDTGVGMDLKAGTEVMTFRDKQRTGLLRVTDEIRPPYVAMEIQEGAPSLGDQAAVDESHPAPAATPPSD